MKYDNTELQERLNITTVAKYHTIKGLKKQQISPVNSLYCRIIKQ